MYQAEYKRLKREYGRLDRLYPDQGRSFRPWEAPLRKKIEEIILRGQEAGEAWAEEAWADWIRPY